MTAAQKFFFDLNGWLLVPGVLSESETSTIRQQMYDDGDTFSGPAQELLDHPALVPILSAIIGDAAMGDDYYNFRCEGSFVSIRSSGFVDPATSKPHRGPQDGPFKYQCNEGTIYSGLTRVVWELNPVRETDGATQFLSGSHKANFPFPAEVSQPDSALLKSYNCPAGSLLIFTESLWHAGAQWTNPDVDRVAIFSAYNSHFAQFHRLNLAAEKIEAMPAKRQSLFRGVFGNDFTKPYPQGVNRYYNADNRAL